MLDALEDLAYFATHFLAADVCQLVGIDVPVDEKKSSLSGLFSFPAKK